MNYTRCNVFEPISQQTVLAMLQAPSVIGIHVGETVEYTNASGLSQQLAVQKVERTTVTLVTNTGLITVPTSQIKTNNPRVMLDTIPLDSWTITSFDSRSRVVCIDINTVKGVRHMSVTLAPVKRLP